MRGSTTPPPKDTNLRLRARLRVTVRHRAARPHLSRMIRRKTAILVMTQLLQVPELELPGSELTSIRSTKRRKQRMNKRLMTKHLQRRRGTIRRHWRKRRKTER